MTGETWANAPRTYLLEAGTPPSQTKPQSRHTDAEKTAPRQRIAKHSLVATRNGQHRCETARTAPKAQLG
ncbi:MAG TPA: hypothetical protein DCE55_17685 [Planctomycetaceae bacterium]|nr:hypothetical protein [Planctomycetaceae bacterium]